MISSFLENYVKFIVSFPEDITIDVQNINSGLSKIIIYANVDDVGSLIGENGKMINSLKTLINGCRVKKWFVLQDTSY